MGDTSSYAVTRDLNWRSLARYTPNRNPGPTLLPQKRLGTLFTDAGDPIYPSAQQVVFQNLKQIHPSPSLNECEQSEQACRIWGQKFGARHFSLSRHDPEPFKIGRRLGGGGFGLVSETTLDGIALAIKRTYTRKLTSEQLNEI
jgi:hypothetical protein